MERFRGFTFRGEAIPITSGQGSTKSPSGTALARQSPGKAARKRSRK
jgi:hypothetical protein